ncbi:MAG: glycoside hydrolase [Chloroflexi bacterium]|nr:glycoside hydrolase [Chloroflexota bacterium]
MQYRLTFLGLLALALLLVACRQSTPPPSPTPTEPVGANAITVVPTATPIPMPEPSPTPEPTLAAEPPLYLSIIWHQHQPIYFKDPETGIYQKPWVRLHAAKDYVDMAAMLEKYPDIQVTFNLTPSLLRQLQDLAAGAQDLYAVHTLVPAATLTDAQKAFIARHFFDINSKIIARFPRYQEIADVRDQWKAWDTQTWLDLQVLFNLAWTDPDWLAQEPLANLVAKGQDFAEADKEIVLGEHNRLIAEVIPLHKRLQEDGRIEVTMTPFFHPILPLLFDTDLARVAIPDIELPTRFSYPLDAIAQVQMGVQFYEDTFGRAPRGMWPPEGAVAQEIVNMIGKEGIQWIATDEEVLAHSLGQSGFARNSSETVLDPDALYRPYIAKSAKHQVYVVFRDKVISDKVGFTYSGTPGTAAAKDFVRRILAIREQLRLSGAKGPHLVSVILDGENAWENYANDGKDFLNNMYRLLQEEQRKGTIQTITPSAYIAQFPEQPVLDHLWPGSWVSPDYLTWIGEPEENRAWDYLGKVRQFAATRSARVDEEARAEMMDAIYTAEGSDWFWWYGADQNSGDDASFDEQFRRTLMRVYTAAGKPVPTFLKVPIIPARTQAPVVSPSGLIAPDIDGVAADGEWDAGGYYSEEGGVQANPNQVIRQIWYGFDKGTLYLRADARRPWAAVGDDVRIGFYFTQPGARNEQPFSRISVLNNSEQSLLGFSANALLEVHLQGDSATATYYTVDKDGTYVEAATDLPVGVAGSVIEAALPYDVYGKPAAGDRIKLRLVVSEAEARDMQVAPGQGPGEMIVPDLGLTTPILSVADPEGDDHGPGSYIYPKDSVFGAKAYDLIQFDVAEDDNNLIFRFTFAGPLNNDWGAPNGMGIHTLDVYIDAVEGGARKLLPGRNAAVPADQAWDFAIWAEGWTPGLYGPPQGDEPNPVQIGDAATLNILSDPGQRRITIRVPKQTLADALGVAPAELNPQAWGYLGVVLSQEGFPAGGVWRVRDVNVRAEQWRLGGAPKNSTTHTRIIDVAYPADFSPGQEEALSNYTPQNVSLKDFDGLSADDFAQLPMVKAP